LEFEKFLKSHSGRAFAKKRLIGSVTKLGGGQSPIENARGRRNFVATARGR
jgi:hypothetical protein